MSPLLLILFSTILCEIGADNVISYEDNMNMVVPKEDFWEIFLKGKGQKEPSKETLGLSQKNNLKNRYLVVIKETTAPMTTVPTTTTTSLYRPGKIHESLLDLVEKREHFHHSAVEGWYF